MHLVLNQMTCECAFSSWESRINDSFSGDTETLLVASWPVSVWSFEAAMKHQLQHESSAALGDSGVLCRLWWILSSVTGPRVFDGAHVQPHWVVSPWGSGLKKCPGESICTCAIQRFIMFDSWGPFVSSKSCIEARTSRESILSCSLVPYGTYHITPGL